MAETITAAPVTGSENGKGIAPKGPESGQDKSGIRAKAEKVRNYTKKVVAQIKSFRSNHGPQATLQDIADVNKLQTDPNFNAEDLLDASKSSNVYQRFKAKIQGKAEKRRPDTETSKIDTKSPPDTSDVAKDYDAEQRAKIRRLNPKQRYKAMRNGTDGGYAPAVIWETQRNTLDSLVKNGQITPEQAAEQLQYIYDITDRVSNKEMRFKQYLKEYDAANERLAELARGERAETNTLAKTAESATNGENPAKQVQIDAVNSLFKNGTIDQAEYDAKIARLNQQLPSEVPKSQPQTPEATPPPEATVETPQQPSTKEIMISLGVDPTSEAGKELFKLIDADPASEKDVLAKVNQAKDLQAKIEEVFQQESGLKLNGKNAFNFALGEITTQYKTDLEALAASDTSTETASTVEKKRKVLNILMTLLKALGYTLLAAGAVSVALPASGVALATSALKK